MNQQALLREFSLFLQVSAFIDTVHLAFLKILMEIQFIIIIAILVYKELIIDVFNLSYLILIIHTTSFIILKLACHLRYED